MFNGIFQVLNAALDGFGLAHVPEDIAGPHIGKVVSRVLDDWCPLWPGYHLYYRAVDNPRQPSRYWWMRCDIEIIRPPMFA